MVVQVTQADLGLEFESLFRIKVLSAICSVQLHMHDVIVFEEAFVFGQNLSPVLFKVLDTRRKARSYLGDAIHDGLCPVFAESVRISLYLNDHLRSVRIVQHQLDHVRLVRGHADVLAKDPEYGLLLPLSVFQKEGTGIARVVQVDHVHVLGGAPLDDILGLRARLTSHHVALDGAVETGVDRLGHIHSEETHFIVTVGCVLHTKNLG
ncbi:hypothetical protein [Cyprinid herpesvirus 2]|nr:hypothetical protein [Cyprinid herpesvirus 2]